MELRECTEPPCGRQARAAPSLDAPSGLSVACGLTPASDTSFTPEVPTLRRVRRLAVFLLPLLAACGSWKRVGSPDAPVGTEQMPRVFDPTAVFRQMGLIADAGPLSIVGSVRLLAGPTPDS